MVRVLAFVGMVAGCTDAVPVCEVDSTVPAYSPDCDTAGLSQYPDEVRVALGGTGGYLLMVLPPALEVNQVYGGTSGNPMTAVLTLASGHESLANSRLSTVRVGDLNSDEALMGLSLSFDEGDITGTLWVPVFDDFQAGRHQAPWP